MNLEQRQALALAQARRRRAQANPAEQFNQALAANKGVEFALPPQGDTQAFQDVAATMGSSIYAEPLAGLAGIATTAYDGPQAGAAVTQDVRQRLTVPMGQAGQQAMQAGIQGVPDVVMDKVVKYGKKYNDFADMAAQAFGPAAGAAVKTLPVALMEIAGAKGAMGVLRRSNASLAMNKRTLAKTLREATARPDAAGKVSTITPSSAELKAASAVLFKEIDNSGVVVNPHATRMMAAKTKKALERVTGAQRRRAPKLWAEIDDLTTAVKAGDGYPVPELVRMRDQVANIAGNKLDAEAAAAQGMREALDEVLDGLTAKNLTGAKSGLVGDQLKQARELWRRHKRSDAIDAAIDNATSYRTDKDSALRMSFRQLVKSKDFKYFTAAEQKMLRGVRDGGLTENALRYFGRLGVGPGFMSTVLGGSAGYGVGAYLFGPAGGVAVPVLGTFSKALAGRLQANNARFALDMVKAGRDAQRIVASYMLHTPKGRQVPGELAQLLMNPQVDIRGLSGAGNSIISQARLQALANRARIMQALAAQAAGAQASGQLGQE